MMCFESGLKSIMANTWARMLNEILQIIIALKVLHVIASDIAESGYYSIMADDSINVSTLNSL